MVGKRQPFEPVPGREEAFDRTPAVRPAGIVRFKDAGDQPGRLHAESVGHGGLHD